MTSADQRQAVAEFCVGSGPQLLRWFWVLLLRLSGAIVCCHKAVTVSSGASV